MLGRLNSRRLLAISLISVLFLGIAAPVAQSTQVAIASYQIKVIDPRNSAHVPSSTVVIESYLGDDEEFQKYLTNGQGVATIALREGTHFIEVIPGDSDYSLLTNLHVAFVSSTGAITFKSSISTTTQPFLLPVQVANVWGTVNFPITPPSPNAGIAIVDALNTENAESISDVATSANRQFGLNLYPGTWQIKARWQSGDETTEDLLHFGPSGVSTVVIDANKNATNFSSNTGLNLLLQAPTITGTITLPNGSRISGWRIKDPNPNWVNIKEERTPYIDFRESTNSLGQGNFALWINPAYKPAQLSFTVVSNNVGYSKTIDLPTFTDTLNLGSILAEESNKLVVNLGSASFIGSLHLQRLNLAECNSCWNNFDSIATENSPQVSFYHLVTGDTYRVLYEPNNDEPHLISTTSPSFTVSSASTNISLTPTSVSLRQFKIVNPITNVGLENARLTIITDDKSFYKWGTTNNQGIVSLGAPSGTYRLLISPDDTTERLTSREFTLEISPNGNYNINSGVSTTTEPYILPLSTVNVWGSVTAPDNMPQQIGGYARIEFIPSNGNETQTLFVKVPGSFSKTLPSGTWQVRTTWLGKSLRMYSLGPADTATVVVNNDGTSNLNPTGSGLVLAMKPPNVFGIITKPDDSRISGWRVEDPDPDWAKIKEKGGYARPLSAWESPDSGGQGEFALWIDPNLKPKSLRFSLETESAGYVKTIQLPELTNSINFGTVAAVQTDNLRINLPSSDVNGTLRVEQRKKNDCQSCWTTPIASRQYQTEGNSSVVIRLLPEADYDYRVVFDPSPDEFRFMSTATSNLILPIPTTGLTINLKAPSLIGKLPTLTKNESKGYFAEVILLREETYAPELVAKGFPTSRWYEEERRYLYNSSNFAFSLKSGVAYRLYVNPGNPSQTSPVFVTNTFAGPEDGTSLGEVQFTSDPANLSGVVSAGGALLANHEIRVISENRKWDQSLLTHTDSLGRYYLRLPTGTHQVSANPRDVNATFSSLTVNCAVPSDATKLDCNLPLPQNNLRFTFVSASTDPVKMGSILAKIDDVTDPASPILPIEKYFNFEFNSNIQKPSYGSGIEGVRLNNGRYLLTSFAQLQSGVAYGTALYEVIVASNVVVSVRNLLGGASIVGNSGIYSLPLPVANISGTFTLDGTTVNQFYGWPVILDKFSRENISTRNLIFDGNGKYFDYQLPGNYSYEFRSSASSDKGLGNVRLKNCSLTSLSVAVTCNLNASRNFRAVVKRSNNEVANNGEVRIFERRPDGSLNNGIWTSLNNLGEMELVLLDGDYELHVESTINGSNREISRLWIDVRAGVVTRATGRNSTTPLSQVDSKYQIATAFVGIAGTVVAPNGTTPVAGAQVSAFSDRSGRGVTSLDSGRFEFPYLDADGIWRLTADAPSGTRVEMGQSNPVNVTVLDGVGSSDVILALRSTTLRGTIFGSAGAIKGGWVEFRQLQNSATGQWVWAGGAEINQQGQFGAVLPPGTYYYVVRPIDSTIGVATMSGACTVPTTGFVLCDTTLAQPNFVGKILKADGTLSLDSSSYIRQIRSGQSSITNSIAALDVKEDGRNKNGLMRFNLSDGEWILYAYPGSDAVKNSFMATFRILVSNNQVTSVENLSTDPAGLITPVDGAYALPLKAINLSGQVTFQGKHDSFNSLVRVVNEISTEKGIWYNRIVETWTRDEGRFELNVKPGTYQLEVVPYIWNSSAFTSGLPAFTRKLNCVVPSSGSVTCDVAVNSANLLGSVTDAAGVPKRQTHINVFKSDANGNQTWVDHGIRVDSEANFFAYFEDGVYQVTIAPYWEYRLNLIERSYRVTVVGGVITEVSDIQSNQVLTKDGSNRYTFKFGTPSVMGTVLMPGSSTETVANVRIEVTDSDNNIRWDYRTYTNDQGQFSLALPDGSYQIRAVNDGKIRNAFKSQLVPITVTNATSPSVTLRLREANLTGVVVLPGSSAPVANVNVNMYVDGEWHYTWTDATGTFGMFVENSNPNCPSKCFVNLNTWALPGYLPKSYPINAIGNLGNLAVGVANTRISVMAPLSDGATVVDVGGWVYVQRLDTNGNPLENMWGSVDKNSFAYFSFEQGSRYRIYANPGYELAGKFSAKVVDVASHSQTADQVTYTVTYDSPNLNMLVRGWDGTVNSWGYYRVLDSDQKEIAQGSMNFAGQAALSITSAGTYTMVLYPGKTKGVVKTVTFTVTAGVISSSDFALTNGVTTIDLPRGNVEGLTRYHDGAVAKEVLVTAVRADDVSIVAKTSSTETGKYFLNLERTYTWNISFFDPQTSRVGSYTLASTTESPVPTLNNLNLDFAAPPL